jgi:hypothetical protein
MDPDEGKGHRMADPSYFSKGVLAALIQVSGDTCYWPEPRCLVPVTVDVDGDKILNVEIAHIRAAHPNGPRYVPSMTALQRRKFANLLLLCPAHHRVIDVLHPGDFSIEILDEWKRAREAGNYSVLSQMPWGIDADRLEDMLTGRFAAQQRELERQVSRFEAALEKLAAIDSEAASLIGKRMEAAGMLLQAGRMLIHTEDTSEILAEAGRSLRHTEDTADELMSAAIELRGLQDSAETLIEAATILRPVMASVAELEDAASSLGEAHQLLSALDERLTERISQLDEFT